MRTELALVAVIAMAATARADDDARILASDPHAGVEEVEVRTMLLDQHGHGFQSQAGALGAAGSEAMWLIEPVAIVHLRTGERWSHEVSIPVDVITAASPDAVDAMSSASRRNESVDVDVRSTFRRDDEDTYTTHVAFHQEEPLQSKTAGAGWRRSLADGNATIGVSGTLVLDSFDDRDHTGRFTGGVVRWTANASISGSQLLSPTTIVDASYGITQQLGRLSGGWNAVPAAGGSEVIDERLPFARQRHAATIRIAQHVPATRSTAKLAYRAYTDTFGIVAHTVELSAYQYLAPWLYVRGGYRFHHQSAARFFTTMYLGNSLSDSELRTADSDLARLSANEWSAELVTLPSRRHRWMYSAELLRYQRTNDLAITAVSLGIGRRM